MHLIHTIYEPAGSGPYPTVLALHGRAANSLDLLGLAPYLCSGRLLMICPQGSVETPIGPGAAGYAWYPMTMGGPPDIAGILSARDTLRMFLDECLMRYPIDAEKLIVLGFSQGGVMAYSLALENPERFAAMAVLSSWLPKELAATLSIGDGAKSLPVLVQHGLQDQLIEVARARDSVEALRSLKIPVTYSEYEIGHEITPKSLTDLSAWLEEKVLSSRAKTRDL